MPTAQDSKLQQKLYTFTIANTVILVSLIIVVIILSFFVFRLYGSQHLGMQILSEVAQLTEISPWEVPDIEVVTNADGIRAANPIQQQVYANAKNGDYAIAYQDKLIIYRRSTQQIIYSGRTPGGILTEAGRIMSEQISKKLAEAKFTIQAGDTPQLSVVSDANEFKKLDASFYAQVQVNDVVATYPVSQIITIYRPVDEILLNTASFKTSITVTPK